MPLPLPFPVPVPVVGRGCGVPGMGAGMGGGGCLPVIINWYWLEKVVPCTVALLPEETMGMAVLVQEYCMEAKMPLAASVCSAVAVQVAMKALSLFLPSFGTALGA